MNALIKIHIIPVIQFFFVHNNNRETLNQHCKERADTTPSMAVVHESSKEPSPMEIDNVDSREIQKSPSQHLVLLQKSPMVAPGGTKRTSRNAELYCSWINSGNASSNNNGPEAMIQFLLPVLYHQPVVPRISLLDPPKQQGKASKFTLSC